MNNLREYRIRQLLTQKQLAEKSGVSQVTISFIENQLSNPMDLTKQKLARALAVAPEELFPEKPRRTLRR
ncbi:MAG TPA: helix-turn-helix transcriptional regulator [bacterium]|nr:helix-turn-helix transcriptional regulator [bacterium]